MTRRYKRPPSREERLDRWQRFLDSCSDEERTRFAALPERLREGYRARCCEKAVTPHFGADGAAELLVALVDFIQQDHRTFQVRKGVPE